MKYLLHLSFLLTASLSFSQLQFQVREALSGESVPFVKVVPENQLPFLTDIDGIFSIDTSTTRSFLLKNSGYRDTLYQLSAINGNIIYIRENSVILDEVKIIPGINPALRIIENAIASRSRNDPKANDAFEYDSYGKFYFTIDPKVLEQIPDNTKDKDLISLRELVSTQYLFLLENSSQRQFIPPYKDKEVITAYKVSGFTNPMFSTFTNMLQSFSFYENQFDIMGKTYINPIAFGSTKRYNYLIEDTTVTGRDTTYTISYYPKPGKNFDGLKGKLFISTNGWAIEKVIAEPNSDDSGNQVKIIQEYVFTNNKKWFPSKLSAEIAIPSLQINNKLDNSYIIGKGSTYIRNVVFNPDLKKSHFGNVTIETAADAGEKSTEYWDSIRIYRITDTEQKTYHSIDSISNKYKLEKKLNLVTALANGKLPVGYFNIDLSRIIDFNLYEGYRIGAGLETSEKMMKRITVGGYFAWGSRDKEWKYGGFSEFKLAPRRDLRILAEFHQDVLNRGGIEFLTTRNTFSIDRFYRNFYIKNMERQKLAQLAVSGYILPSVKIAVFGNYQRINMTGDYMYTPMPLDPSNRSFDVSEAGIELNWKYGERFMLFGNTRVSQGSKYPRCLIKVVKGIADIKGSKQDYLRLNAEISHTISLRAFGKFNWSLSASKTWGDVPLFLLQNPRATGKNWNLSVPNTFETMLPSTFYSDEQVSLFTRLSFLPWKTSIKIFQPRLSLHHAIGFGQMHHPEDHINGGNFKTMEKGYYEGGIIIDHILSSNLYGIGLGLFTNYGHYAKPQFDKNLMIKLSISFNL